MYYSRWLSIIIVLYLTTLWFNATVFVFAWGFVSIISLFLYINNDSKLFLMATLVSLTATFGVWHGLNATAMKIDFSKEILGKVVYYDYRVDGIRLQMELDKGGVISVVAHGIHDMDIGYRISVKCWPLKNADNNSPCITDNIKVLNLSSETSFGKIIISSRNFVISTIGKSLPEPYASLGDGILIGSVHYLPKNISNDFRRAGISHIVAVSGFNVGIVISLICLIMPILNFSRRTSLLMVILLVVFYAMVTGAGASVLRAAIMGLTFSLGGAINVAINRRNLILLSAAALATYNPSFLTHDIGFQLSYAATIGIIGGSSLFNMFVKLYNIKLGKWPKALLGACVVSWSAWLASLPLILFYFGSTSVTSLLANVLISPLVPLAMFAVMAILVTFFIPYISYFCALFTKGVLWSLIYIAELFGERFYVGFFTENLSGSLVVIIYLIALIISAIIWCVLRQKNLQKSRLA